MAPRVKTQETADPAREGENEPVSQRRRGELGRYLLQVDRQTKRSFATAGDAEAAGRVIKKGYPLVQVSIYDSVELVSTPIELSAQPAPATAS
jgi:hypothetical protein